jgi:transcriptional antiterminator NusG
MIYTVKTTSGREDIVSELMGAKARGRLDIKAIFHPSELKGYIFIEGSVKDIHKASQGLMHIRGIIETPAEMKDLEHFIAAKTAAAIKIDESDVVEIVGGPFKGEKGKIQRIDKAKSEVTVELLEAAVPIPVTIATEFVKLVKKAAAPKTEEAPAETKG